MILSCQSSRRIVTGHASPCKTFPYHTRSFIHTDQTADRGFTAYRSLKAAVFNGSVVDAAQTADAFLFIRCNDFSF